MANDVLLLRIPPTTLDCLISFLGISLSRVVSSFGLPVYSSIHSRRITKCPKIGHYGRVVFPKVAEAAGNARGVPNGPPPIRTLNPWVLFGRRDAAEHLKLTGGATASATRVVVLFGHLTICHLNLTAHTSLLRFLVWCHGIVSVDHLLGRADDPHHLWGVPRCGCHSASPGTFKDNLRTI